MTISELIGAFGSQAAGKNLQLCALSGNGNIAAHHRGLFWRMVLGVLPIPDSNLSTWTELLQQQCIDYCKLKDDLMPSLTKVAADPLSGLVNDGNDSGGSDEWAGYYKNIELSNFINGDLDRLYMNGLADDYFQVKGRRQLLLSVLLLWALDHKKTSYRQGMHEIAGPVLYVLETELGGLATHSSASKDVNPLNLSQSTLEAHTYFLFSRIMRDLEILYDPTPSPSSPDKQPAVVSFCTEIQETDLRALDPQLCQHLEDSCVQAQLYGMRWARLLFGREFPLTHTHSLRVWDYLFASCFELNDGDVHEISLHADATSQLLKSVSAFVLAMLLSIRDDLLCDDSNVTMGLLMHYPPLGSVGPIIEMCNSIRRRKNHSGFEAKAAAAGRTSSYLTNTRGSDAPPLPQPMRKQEPIARSPSWLLGSKQHDDDAINSNTASRSFQRSEDPFPLQSPPKTSSALAALLGNVESGDSIIGRGITNAISSISSTFKSSNFATASPLVPVPSSTSAAPNRSPATPDHNTAVSDRLHSISEQLIRMHGNAFIDESEVRMDTAKKIRMLANVLSGIGELREYDAMFNKGRPDEVARF